MGIDAKIDLALTFTQMKIQREYRQTARAVSAQRTRQSIIEALFDLAQERLFTEISLADVATRAGVSVQTILRQFGDRATLVEESIAYGVELVRSERAADPADPESALAILLDHYELRGRMTLLMLAQESTESAIARVVEGGRTLHRDWVRTNLAGTTPGEATIDLLVVATDVYAWKIWRIDRGLTRAETQRRMHTMVECVLAGQER